MAEAAKVWVLFGLQAQNFFKGMQGVEKKMRGFEKQMKSVNYISKTLNNIGTTLTKRVTLPIVAAGAAALVAFEQMDDGYDTIRLKSGATGQVLEDLNRTLKATVGVVPNAIGDTADAMALLYARTGQTGANLQALSVQMLNLSRISETEVEPLVSSMTRMFGDWGIATKDQATSMDWLWKTAQATGSQVDSLSNTLTQFGAPLRQMGFTFKDSAVMLGKWEKEGVNVELVLGSLRVALGKMAKAGIPDTGKALRVLIQRIKEAGSTGKANAIALEAFGARAGPDMAAAIREGRFDIDALVKRLTNSNETINKASFETMSWLEALSMLKNQLIAVTEPLGGKLNKLLLAISPDIEKIVNWIGRLIDKFTSMPDKAQNFVLAMAISAAALGPLMKGLAGLLKSISLIEAAIKTLTSAKTAAAVANAAAAAQAAGTAGAGAAGAGGAGGLAGGVAAGGLAALATATGVVTLAGAGMAGIAYAGPLLPEYERRALPGAMQAHAEGGIITRPIWGMDSSGTRHLFGEAGPEAVVPLGRLGTNRIEVSGTVRVEGYDLTSKRLVGVAEILGSKLADNVRANQARYATAVSPRRAT